eukprot:SAG31_NODE_33738_length_340_cov_1.153527_1_plen_109_part_10
MPFHQSELGFESVDHRHPRRTASAGTDVDVIEQTITLNANCENAEACATILDSVIDGATVSTDGNRLLLLSDTAGLASSVTVLSAGSGPNALRLFGSGSRGAYNGATFV